MMPNYLNLQSKIHSFAKYFFPPNFSFVFCKRKKFGGKKFTLQKIESIRIYFAKEFLPIYFNRVSDHFQIYGFYIFSSNFTEKASEFL
jgi:hypothetical protein